MRFPKTDSETKQLMEVNPAQEIVNQHLQFHKIQCTYKYTHTHTHIFILSVISVIPSMHCWTVSKRRSGRMAWRSRPGRTNPNSLASSPRAKKVEVESAQTCFLEDTFFLWHFESGENVLGEWNDGIIVCSRDTFQTKIPWNAASPLPGVPLARWIKVSWVQDPRVMSAIGEG